MSIQGSLETFSLPELFQTIESGGKSGRLTFEPENRASDSSKTITYELWFDQGNFVAIINPLKQHFLNSKMINLGWINIKVLARNQSNCPKDQAIGRYLAAQNLINQQQLYTLFEAQIQEVIKLFRIYYASFIFEELDEGNNTTSQSLNFPWLEMTGEQRSARELSLEAMRSFPYISSRFTAEMPPANCGLQRLVNNCSLRLDTLEKYLCNMADGSISLRKIAQKMEVSIDKVQTTALSMILAGVVEEVPVISADFVMPAKVSYASIPSISSDYSSKPAFTQSRNQTAKAKSKPQVSNSLLRNLTNFLKNNF